MASSKHTLCNEPGEQSQKTKEMERCDEGGGGDSRSGGHFVSIVGGGLGHAIAFKKRAKDTSKVPVCGMGAGDSFQGAGGYICTNSHVKPKICVLQRTCERSKHVSLCCFGVDRGGPAPRP